MDKENTPRLDAGVRSVQNGAKTQSKLGAVSTPRLDGAITPRLDQGIKSVANGAITDWVKLDGSRKYEPKHPVVPEIGRQMPTIELVIETKKRLQDMPVGGDLNLTVQEYALNVTTGAVGVTIPEQTVDTGTWAGDPLVRSDDGEHTHVISPHTHPLGEHVHIGYGNAVTSEGFIDPSTSPLPIDPFDETGTSTALDTDAEESDPGVHTHKVRIPAQNIEISMITAVGFTPSGDPYVLCWRNGLFKDEFAVGSVNIPAFTSAHPVERTMNILHI